MSVAQHNVLVSYFLLSTTVTAPILRGCNYAIFCFTFKFQCLLTATLMNYPFDVPCFSFINLILFLLTSNSKLWAAKKEFHSAEKHVSYSAYDTVGILNLTLTIPIWQHWSLVLSVACQYLSIHMPALLSSRWQSRWHYCLLFYFCVS